MEGLFFNSVGEPGIHRKTSLNTLGIQIWVSRFWKGFGIPLGITIDVSVIIFSRCGVLNNTLV